MKYKSKAKFLITGGKGQLANAFCTLLDNYAAKYIALDIDELDITDINQLATFCKEFQPDFLINCAAYNNVDATETDYETALNVNMIGPKNIATLSLDFKFKAIHFGTDYVFPGRDSFIPYKETDDTSPINKYGLSKLKGEKIFLEITPKNLVYRVSWLYGKGKQNFIFKLLQWAKIHEELLIANDEISIPTSTQFVAANVLQSLDCSGIFHLVPDGYVSRYDYAKLVFHLFKINKNIKPVSSSYFKLPAKRPHFSALDSNYFFNTINKDKLHWSEYLIRFLSSFKLQQ